MRTVITHFFNEEYLLPWWLAHHKPMFDHGILIDYGSTDRSLDICRQLAPDWTLVRSRNVEFAALEVDFEVMQYEHELPGWKIVLNTTEFLVAPNLAAVETAVMGAGAQGAWCPSFIMVDVSPESAPSPDRPLVLQKSFGISSRDVDMDPVYRRLNMPNPAKRDRLYHRASFGAYLPGRHISSISNQCVLRDGAYLLWYAHAPWTPAFRQRKAQIRTRIPEKDRAAGLGLQHFLEEDDLDRLRRELLPMAEDLTPRLV